MSSKKECLKQMRNVIDGVLSTVDSEGNPQRIPRPCCRF